MGFVSVSLHVKDSLGWVVCSLWEIANPRGAALPGRARPPEVKASNIKGRSWENPPSLVSDGAAKSSVLWCLQETAGGSCSLLGLRGSTGNPLERKQ